MNRNEAKKLAPIIKAFGDGKDVQYHSMDRHWITADEEYNPVFDSTVEWRIKPEPRVFWIYPIGLGKWEGCEDKSLEAAYLGVIKVVEDIE